MSSPEKSTASSPFGGGSPSATAQGSDSSNITPSREQPAAQLSGSPANMPLGAMAGNMLQVSPAGPATNAPKSSRAAIAELTRKLQAKHQANQAAREEERLQQQRAEERERDRKREREASPILDPPQRTPAIEIPTTREESDDDGSIKLTPGSSRSGVSQVNGGQGTDVPQKPVITRELADRFVSFPRLKSQLKPRNIPCSIGVPRGLCIGSTQKRSDGWMVFLSIDGGYHGDPSLALIFEANLRKGENERVSKNPNEINGFVLRWYPGTVLQTADSRLASQHHHERGAFSFEEVPKQDHPPLVSSSRSRRSNAEKIQKPMMMFSLTNASLSLEGTPMSSTWQQYGDVKDVVDELTSGQQCTFTVTVGTELHGANRYATQMLWDAYKKRFRPLFTYNQQSFRPTVTLDLRLKTTVKEIGDALERHLPSAKVWRDGGSGDTKWTPVQLFDLPKHLYSLLRLGIRINPGGAGDETTGNLDQGSLGAKGRGKVVEEAEEGSEEGEILG